jgi:hypothetical protein
MSKYLTSLKRTYWLIAMLLVVILGTNFSEFTENLGRSLTIAIPLSVIGWLFINLVKVFVLKNLK